MPKTIFITTGFDFTKKEGLLNPVINYIKVIVEALNEKQEKSTYLIQDIRDEDTLYQYIKQNSGSTQPVLHLILDSKREDCFLTPEKLQQFKYKGGMILVTVIEFEKHRFDSYKLGTLSYINLADQVIFSEQSDKVEAEKASGHYYPTEKRLKRLIAEAHVFSAYPLPGYLAKRKAIEERGSDIIFQGELRAGMGLAHVRKLAECIAESSAPAVKDKKVIILGTIEDELQYNRVLRDLMIALYPTKASECRETKNARELMKLLLEYENSEIKPALPIELHINPSEKDLPAFYDRTTYCFLPLYNGATLKEACFKNALQQHWITYSHIGHETPSTLQAGGSQADLFILREDDDYNSYASDVLKDIERREIHAQLNRDFFDRMRKASGESPSQDGLLLKHLYFYRALIQMDSKEIKESKETTEVKETKETTEVKETKENSELSAGIGKSVTSKNTPFDSSKLSLTSGTSIALGKLEESPRQLVHAFRDWRDMPLQRKYAVLQEARSHAQMNKIKNIHVISKSEINFRALLNRLKKLIGPYSEEMKKFLSEKQLESFKAQHKKHSDKFSKSTEKSLNADAAYSVMPILTLEERRFVKTLLGGAWRVKHVTKDIKIISEKGNQLLSLEERKRRSEKTNNSHTPPNEGHTNNVFMSFGPGDIETVRFLDDVPSVVEGNFRHLLGDETPKNIKPDPFSLHGVWSSDHFYAYNTEQVGEPVNIYGIRYQVNYKKRLDETTGKTRYVKECHFTTKEGHTSTQTIELGDEIFSHPRLDIAQLLLTVEKIRLLGKNAWEQVMQETDLTVLQRIVQTFYHTGVLEIHKPEQFLIDQPGVALKYRTVKNAPDHSGLAQVNRSDDAFRTLQAAVRGEADIVLKAIAAGLSINEIIALSYPYNGSSLSLLAGAILGGQFELVQKLLDMGVDLNAKFFCSMQNPDGSVPETQCMLNNNLDVAIIAADPKRVQPFFKMVLEKTKEDLEIKVDSERSFQILKLLFEQGSRNNQNKQIQLLLTIDDEYALERIIRTLIPIPRVLNYLVKRCAHSASSLPLVWTAYLGTCESVMEMLKLGAKINQKRCELIYGDFSSYKEFHPGFNALFASVLKKDIEMMTLLLSQGALVDAICYYDDEHIEKPTHKVEDPVGFTPLMLAVQQNFKEGVELLLRSGANITCRSVTGKTAISLAKKAGNDEITFLLLKSLRAIKETALMQSVAKEDWEKVRTLLNEGVDDLAMNEKGESVYDLYPAFLNHPGIPLIRQVETCKLYSHNTFVVPVGRLSSGEKFIVLKEDDASSTLLPFLSGNSVSFSKSKFMKKFIELSDFPETSNKIHWKELGQVSMGVKEAGVHLCSQLLCCDLGVYDESALSKVDTESCKVIMESTWRKFNTDLGLLRKHLGFFCTEPTRIIVDNVMQEKSEAVIKSDFVAMYEKLLLEQFRLLELSKEGDIKGIDEILKRGMAEPNYDTPTAELLGDNGTLSAVYSPLGMDIDGSQITPFQMMVAHKKWDCALQFLEYVPINISTVFGCAQEIVRAGQLKLFQMLCKNPGRVLSYNIKNFLNTAIEYSKLEIVQYIFTLRSELGFEADVHKCLSDSVKHCQPNLLKYFLEIFIKENTFRDLSFLANILVSEKLRIDEWYDPQQRTKEQKEQDFIKIVEVMLPYLVAKGTKELAPSIKKTLEDLKLSVPLDKLLEIAFPKKMEISNATVGVSSTTVGAGTPQILESSPVIRFSVGASSASSYASTAAVSAALLNEESEKPKVESKSIA